jgi:uncharacterized protein
MAVVSNTSPILNLAIIGWLNLLRKQFGKILIPPAVFDELKIGTDLPGSDPVRCAMTDGWLEVVELRDPAVYISLRRDLDMGEAEAIALSLQERIEQVLIDEHDARAAAKAMGLKPIGVLGILLAAKRSGDMVSIGDAMRALQREAGFFIGTDLFALLLREAGEY